MSHELGVSVIRSTDHVKFDFEKTVFNNTFIDIIKRNTDDLDREYTIHFNNMLGEVDLDQGELLDMIDAFDQCIDWAPEGKEDMSIETYDFDSHIEFDTLAVSRHHCNLLLENLKGIVDYIV